MNKKTIKECKRFGVAMAFLAPNVIGFFVFVLVPLLASIAMAFTNWDLTQHNMYKDNPIKFVGLDNFILLFQEDNFIRFFANTVVMMLGIPFGMVLSLGAAILLSANLKGKGKGDARILLMISLITTAVMVAGTCILMLVGMESIALMTILIGFACAMLVGGTTFGSSVYRTMFYLPSFTSGVAVFLMWKKIFNPNVGPLNAVLRGPLESFSGVVASVPGPLVQMGMWIAYSLILASTFLVCRYLRRSWQDGEIGIQGCVLGAVGILIPLIFAWTWMPMVSVEGVLTTSSAGYAATLILSIGSIASVLWLLSAVFKKSLYHCAADYGLGTGLMLVFFVVIIQFAAMGLGVWSYHLPEMAASGITPPNWLTDYHWAKPALIFMGLWSAVGSNSMILYLAGLTAIPESLYEAADIDGAKGFQRFWHITWPQLAPVTFFIFVMAMIGGLQGGFETAKTMTAGGPDGSTTTLAYYIYAEGFETGRLGFASAVAWAMFVLVFSVTIFNWKFGSKYND